MIGSEFPMMLRTTLLGFHPVWLPTRLASPNSSLSSKPVPRADVETDEDGVSIRPSMRSSWRWGDLEDSRVQPPMWRGTSPNFPFGRGRLEVPTKVARYLRSPPRSYSRGLEAVPPTPKVREWWEKDYMVLS